MECFTVLADEIEGRIDPFFNKPSFIESKDLLEKGKYELKLIKEISEFVVDGIHKTPEYSSEGLKFIQVNNLSEGKINFFKNIKFVSKSWQKEVLERYTPKEGDVLITKDGTIGIAATIQKIEENFSIFVSVACIRPNQKLIIPKYLEILLNSSIIKDQITRATRGAALVHLLLEDIRKLKIPLPPIETQNKIVQLMDKAYSSKKSKETESQKLIDSINDYVLDELGIKFNEIVEDKMCFVVDYDDIQKGRIDPNNFANPQDTPSSNKFKEKTLIEIAKLVRGQSITKENITSGDYPVIAGGQSSPYSINAYNHKENVITVSASGAYSGYVWYHNYPIFASDCTVIKSSNEKEVSTFYLYCVMKAKQKFIYHMQQGAGQPHVYSKDLSKLKIPLPTLAIQNKIAEEVKQRMQKAEQLQKEAKEDLEKAKEKVENMILG